MRLNVLPQELYLVLRKRPAKTKINSPVFVVGCGHSGTTVMLAVLDNHSKIKAVPGESRIFYKTILAKLKRFNEWKRMTILSGKSRWVEKTPKHIYKIKEIFRFFPYAQIILMLRDGRDVACSLRDRHHNFERGAVRWIKDNQAGQDHWSDSRVMVVKYEDLVQSTHETLKKIFDFLGESFESDVVQLENKNRKWHSHAVGKLSSSVGRNHAQHRNWQINQPLFNGSGKWLDNMAEPEKRIFKKVAGDLLVSYGYADNQIW